MNRIVTSVSVEERKVLDQYALQLMDPVTGIALSTKRLRFQTYHNVFSGADAAGWFMANMEGITDLQHAHQVRYCFSKITLLRITSSLAFRSANN